MILQSDRPTATWRKVQIQTHHDLVVVTHCYTLAMQYQSLSKRYVPEVITYITNALAVLALKPLAESVDGSPDWHVPCADTQPVSFTHTIKTDKSLTGSPLQGCFAVST